MSLLPGDRLGPYEILSSLGAGGMGAVYRARDPRLQRDVAIKVLHPDKLTDPGRRQRFLVEAKAVSSLNHPNILTVYDTGTEGEIAYLVTELVDGRSLDALIPSAGFPVPEVLRIATQIADALAKAHAAGIVHRDLKPANVMLTFDGRVKVLDFGLAKILEAAPADEATKTMAAQTAEGTIMGTAGYMSPEQAEGKPLDQRSDIFSFGALLYELATGQRAFAGETQMSVIAAVLREDPRPPGELRADLPPELARIIMRCLRKDPARRVQSTADLKVALDELKHESDSGKLTSSIQPGSARPAQTPWLRRGGLAVGLGLATVLVVGLVVGGLVGWRALAPGGAASTTTLQPVPLSTFQGSESWPSFSPDGNQIAFAWNGEAEDNFDIYVKLVGPGTPLRLTTDPAPDIKARWSPDGQKIAFLRQVDSDTVAVLLVSPLGGPETRLGQFYTRRAVIGLLASLCWAADSRHLLMAASQVRDQPNAILRLSIDTREVKTLATLTGAAEGYTNPDLSPDGRTLAAVRVAGARTVELFTLSPSYEVTETRTFDAPGNKVEVVAWTPDGQDLLFSHAVNIPLPIYRASLAGGQPTALSWTGAGAFWPGVSRQSGRLAFSRMVRDTNIWQVTLDAGRDAQPRRRRLVSSSFREVYPRYSPDGRRLAFYSNRSGSVQIWTADADGSRPVPLTSMSATATTGTPRWSPDGARILFDSTESGSYQVYVISADGGPPTALTTGSSNNFCAAWSRDGRWIFFSSSRSGEHQVWKVTPAGGAPEQVTRHGGVSPDVSPDGAWLYYTKSDGAGGLWRMPIEGGEETHVVPDLYRYNYALTDTGVYYTSRPVGAAPSTVRYLDLATGVTTPMLEMDKPPDLGLAISPDGRTLLYTQLDYQGQDLMLVENFR